MIVYQFICKLCYFYYLISSFNSYRNNQRVTLYSNLNIIILNALIPYKITKQGASQQQCRQTYVRE